MAAAATERSLDRRDLLGVIKTGENFYGWQRRRRIQESSLKVADTNLVVVLKRCTRGDQLVIEIRSVTALLVFDVVTVLDTDNLSVFTANRGRRDDDIAIGIAPENEFITV